MKNRAAAFSGRNFKEMLRDPVSYILTLGIPIFMLVLYRCINAAVGEAMNGGTHFYELRYFTPGVAVFSFAFSMLNVALLVSKDRSSSFLTRLCASPMTASDFMLGYTLPTVLLAVGQTIICFAAAFIMGLRANGSDFLLCIITLIPSVFMYISLGLFFGSLFNDKAAPPLASMTATISSLAGGAWFDITIFGKKANTVFHILPFANSVDCAKAAMTGDYGGIVKPLIITVIWTAALYALSILIFRYKMRKDND